MTFDFREHTHIGIDLDETLAATVSGFLEYAHSIGRLQGIRTIEEIHKHDLSGLGQDITPEESMILWEGYGKLTLHPSSVPVVEGSREGVRKLFELGKTLSVVTARSNHESWKIERTLGWLDAHFPYLGRDSVHFVNHFSTEARPKSTVCKEYGITLMIDDALENVYELTRAGIYCLLLEKPWNRDVEYDHPLLTRVKNWSEIIV